MNIDETKKGRSIKREGKIKTWRHGAPKSLSAHLFLWRHDFWMAPPCRQAPDLLEMDWRHLAPTSLPSFMREKREDHVRR